jgi:hypothetical protein
MTGEEDEGTGIGEEDLPELQDCSSAWRRPRHLHGRRAAQAAARLT